MEISAKIVLDSVCGEDRLTTFLLKYPRFIHAELMTHRMFSRNASSSRAIPVNRMVDMALADPAFFVELGKNRKGMQARSQVPEHIALQFEAEWRFLAEITGKFCKKWAAPIAEGGFGLHKQIANRAMEPWHHIQVLVTTCWPGLNNFFQLRDHPKAQPEIRELAREMGKSFIVSNPANLNEGEWHIPFIRSEEWAYDLETTLKLSTARCARTSYMDHDGNVPDIAKDIELHDMLVSERPMHASPLEHAAMASPGRRAANFKGFISYRFVKEHAVNVNDTAAIRLLRS